jgi:hypothetical protein
MLRTRAERGDQWVINGDKWYITGAVRGLHDLYGGDLRRRSAGRPSATMFRLIWKILAYTSCARSR